MSKSEYGFLPVDDINLPVDNEDDDGDMTEVSIYSGDSQTGSYDDDDELSESEDQIAFIQRFYDRPQLVTKTNDGDHLLLTPEEPVIMISPLPRADILNTSYSTSVKVVLLGSVDVGKTQFIYALSAPRTESLRDAKQLTITTPTIGANFSTVIKPVNGIDVIKVTLWDTAGQERFASLMPGYLRDAAAVLVLYDVTSVASFDAVRTRWLPMVAKEKSNNPHCIVALVGNKIDVSPRLVKSRVGEECAKSYGVDAYFETSALERISIHNTLEQTISLVHNLQRRLRGDGANDLVNFKKKRSCCMN